MSVSDVYITQLAKLSFNHPSVVLTADVSQFCIEDSSTQVLSGWLCAIRALADFDAIARLFTQREQYNPRKSRAHKRAYSYAYVRVRISCQMKSPLKIQKKRRPVVRARPKE